MSEGITHANRLVKVWLKADSGSRERLRRDWPELADAIDAITWRPEGEQTGTALHKEAEDFHRRVPRHNEPRCEATYNPGAWPYAARCILIANHPLPNDHIGGDGKEFKTRSPERCDGCKYIKMLEDALTPGDEDGAYYLKRSSRRHRQECPNR